MTESQQKEADLRRIHLRTPETLHSRRRSLT